MVKRLFEDKRAVFFASILAVIALMALAGALNNISFRPAQPIYQPEEQTQTGISMSEIVRDFLEIPLWKQVAFFVTLLLLALLLVLLLSPEMRKRLLRMIVRVAVSVILLYYLFKTDPDFLKRLFPQLNFESGTTDLSAAANVAPPVFEPPQISGALSFFITLGIVLIFAIFAWRLYLWWKEQNELLNAKHPLDKIAKVVRASLQELSRQGASHDAIIKCYENMSQAVFARRGLQRNYAMTAAEFAQRLEDAGLPREPVNQLTRLFESARYSAHTSTQKDIDEAVACLTSILKYCGETP